MEVDVEVLDVDDAEARALLLSIDPLAALADYDAGKLDALRSRDRRGFRRAGRTCGGPSPRPAPRSRRHWPAPAAPPRRSRPEQFLVLVECTDEAEQTALLQRFQAEGLKCRALLS